MKVKILYFALIREIVGIEEEEVEIEGSLNDLLGKVQETRPVLAEIIEKIRNKTSEIVMAVNTSIVNDLSISLGPNDEIAFIPPISGG